MWLVLAFLSARKECSSFKGISLATRTMSRLLEPPSSLNFRESIHLHDKTLIYQIHLIFRCKQMIAN